LKIPDNIRSTSWTHEFFPLFLYNSVRYTKPDLCVELGTLAGYSAFCIATALVDNCKGHLECYDLWEQYPYNHVTKQEAFQNLMGLPVVLNQQDAYYAVKNFKDASVDFLMVDISNDGDTYKRILTDWYQKLSSHATVILEGGCVERDEVEWMVKYNKKPIQSVFKDKDILEKYAITNIGCFPSITIAQRKL
jgi:predicted O-methyltransferase YrrM